METQEKMRAALDGKSKEMDARMARLLQHETARLEARQRARMQKAQQEHAAEAHAMRSAHEAEYAALVEAQAAEVHELTEAVTGCVCGALAQTRLRPPPPRHPPACSPGPPRLLSAPTVSCDPPAPAA